MFIFNRYFNFMSKLYEKEESGFPLAIFRMFYGFILFFEVYQIFYFRHMIFDTIPYEENVTFSEAPFLIIWLISIIFIILGLRTKTAALVNYICSVVIIGFSFHHLPGAIFEYHVDTELITIAFVLIFLPVSRRLSLDRLILQLKYSSAENVYQPKTTVSSLSYIILTLAAGLIYFDSIFYKFASPMWMSGLGVWLPASLPWATWLNLSFILNHEFLIKFLGYLTLVFQATYIFLIWVKKTKTIYLLIGISLHIGIFFAFPIPWFALGIVALYIGMLPEKFYTYFTHRFSKKSIKYLNFYYDQSNYLSVKLKILFQFFDYKNNVTFYSIQSSLAQNKKNNNTNKLTISAHCIDSKEKVFYGLDAYKELFMRIWIFKILGFLLYIFPIYFLVNKAYIFFITRIKKTSPFRANIDRPIDINSIKILQNLDIKSISSFMVGIFILFLIIAQLILIQKSLFMQQFFEKNAIIYKQKALDFSRGFQKIIYPYSGLMSHPVFMDGHFENRTEIYTLRYIKQDQSTEMLPMFQSNGQASYYNTGRQWVNYSFRTMNDLPTFRKQIYRYIYFWAGKNSINLDNSNFEIIRKTIDVPKKWKYNVLNDNLAQPWFTLGKLGWKNKRPYIELLDVPKEIKP